MLNEQQLQTTDIERDLGICVSTNMHDTENTRTLSSFES